jgi:phosphatidylserine decarboxylase
MLKSIPQRLHSDLYDSMTVRSMLTRMLPMEELAFLLSNRIPRRLATRLMGWFSHIESPLLARAAVGLWKRFSDLDLSESKAVRFSSLNACFTRELKAGARPIDGAPTALVSPCDAIVGACGRIDGEMVIQAKGFSYSLEELLCDSRLAELYRNGQYATLRLTPTMYHRFHAPFDCSVEHVSYVPGDTWNVNPAAVKRIPRLYCRNERAVVRTGLAGSGHVVTLVPVAAILVAGIRLHFLDDLLGMQYRGETEIPCQASFRKGEEMGWFQHGSTIIVFAPDGFTRCDAVRAGTTIRMGQSLMRLP